MNHLFPKFCAFSLILSLGACGSERKGSKDESAGNPPPRTEATPIEKVGGTSVPGSAQVLPTTPVLVKALRERSSDEFCAALKEFLQNYTANRLQGTTFALMGEPQASCRLESHKPSLNLHSSLILQRGENSLRLAINIIASYQQNTFTETKLYLDRLGPNPLPYQPSDADRVFGDLTRLESELKSFADLRNAEYRIFNIPALQAYAAIERNYAPANRRSFQTTPRLSLELLAGNARVTEIEASALSGGRSFLRCTDIACLQSGVSYEFVGNDIILYSRAYVDARNQTLKASVRIPLQALQIP